MIRVVINPDNESPTLLCPFSAARFGSLLEGLVYSRLTSGAGLSISAHGCLSHSVELGEIVDVA
jgi:hypothetical protein